MDPSPHIPTHTETEPLTECVELRLTETERIEYKKCAERCGMSLATWIRDRLAEVAKREAKEG
jgi:hypothetical protein